MKKFEGRNVTKTTVAVRNTGDGLSEAMSVAPQELVVGQKVFVLMECEVTGIQHERIKAGKDYTSDLERKARLLAGTATLVEADFAKEKLDEQRLLIEQAQGIERLDFEGDDDDGQD